MSKDMRLVAVYFVLGGILDVPYGLFMIRNSNCSTLPIAHGLSLILGQIYCCLAIVSVIMGLAMPLVSRYAPRIVSATLAFSVLLCCLTQFGNAWPIDDEQPQEQIASEFAHHNPWLPVLLNFAFNLAAYIAFTGDVSKRRPVIKD